MTHVVNTVVTQTVAAESWVATLGRWLFGSLAGVSETAAELDVAVGTVKASFCRANRKLARKLEPLRELWERK